MPYVVPMAFNTEKELDLFMNALKDLETHREAWREALEIALEHAEVEPPDIDDKGYWKHELNVFDRTFEILIGED